MLAMGISLAGWFGPLAVITGAHTNPAGGSYRVKGTTFEIFNADTGKWHAMFLVGANGEQRPVFGAGDATAADADAAMMSATGGASWRCPSGLFELFDGDTAKYHALWVVGAAGEERLMALNSDAGAAGSSVAMGLSGTNYRVSGGLWQFKNMDTGLYHTLKAIGAEGEVRELICAGTA